MVTQEWSDLKKEKLRLETDLEEAHQGGANGPTPPHDLSEAEKLRNEANGREKAVERHCKESAERKQYKAPHCRASARVSNRTWKSEEPAALGKATIRL